MARPKTEITLKIEAVLEKNPNITYNEAVDAGLIDPKEIDVGRFNVNKSNWKKHQTGGTPKATRKRRVPAVPAAPKAAGTGSTGRKGRTTYRQYKNRTLVNVPAVGDLTGAIKTVADAGGMAKAKAIIEQADALRAAVAAVESTTASLAKIA
jgi:hypothetical protein